MKTCKWCGRSISYSSGMRWTHDETRTQSCPDKGSKRIAEPKR